MERHSNRLSAVKDYTLSKVMSMSRRELAQATSVLTQASNKRLARMQKQGITTPATEYIKKHGGRFLTKGKDVNELREEFQRAKGFLESETSTIKGYRAWESKIAETLKTNAGIDYNALTEREKRKFWQAYSKLEELDAANVYGAKYRTSVNEIYTAVKGGLRYKDIDEFVAKMSDKIYVESTKNFMAGVNDPFSLIDDSENPFMGD